MQSSETPFTSGTEKADASRSAAYLTRAQFVHALLVYGGIFALISMQAEPFLFKGWACLVLAWPLWVVRLIRRQWRGGWLGIALTVVPTVVWPGMYLIAALSLG